MLSPHLRKFSEFYECYGLGAVKNLWLLTCMIPIARTVNLNKLKDHVGGLLKNDTSTPDSHYRRLTRFFEDWGGHEGFLHDLMKQNLRFLKSIGHKVLVMDGTSWEIGQSKVHYLVLSVLVGPVAVPIYWVQLEKLGSSSQEERKQMFEKAMKLFNLQGMTLLADREYVGKHWFKFLKDNKIHFVIRMRHGDYVEDVDAALGKTWVQMFAQCAKKQKLIKKQIWFDGQVFTMVMMPNPKVDATEEVLIFLTTLTDAKKAAHLYARRWKIECLFRHLKTNGFNLEDLNLKDAGKNKLMLAIVATAYVLAIREGWHRRKDIPMNKYKNGSEWPETSIFRKGLSILTTICYRFKKFLGHVFRVYSTKDQPIFKNVQ